MKDKIAEDEPKYVLTFYKDKDGTPNVLFDWSADVETLFGGNGFSDIQMRVIVSQHFDSDANIEAKQTFVRLVEALNYAVENEVKEKHYWIRGRE